MNQAKNDFYNYIENTWIAMIQSCYTPAGGATSILFRPKQIQ